ncbi:hypothetical protein GCM10029964_102280 [Kibdelosporangium lantanae]
MHVNSSGTVPSGKALDEVHATAQRIAANVERVLVGKPDVVRIALVTLLAEGHLLVEDVPGVGKTSLAKALARSIDCTVSRLQFTPDLLPSDVTGVSVFNRQTTGFEFRPGPVFANIVVGDEINRASPKTQSALLECMEEHQVTVDGKTYRLESPFMVIATQNPIEMEGTYALPEAQRDRFTARVSIGYPDPAAELAMVDEHAGHDPLTTLQPVSDADQIRSLVEAVRAVHISPEIRRYAVELVSATRRLPEIRLGASPGRPCTSCVRPVRRPRCPAVTSSSPTTSTPWPSRCWRTGSCSRPRRRPPAAPRGHDPRAAAAGARAAGNRRGGPVGLRRTRR